MAARPADGPLEVDLLLRGCAVVTMDARNTQIADGAIAIKGQRIQWLGRARDAKARVSAKAVIDARGTIAMPGLIDAHFHTAQQLLRGKIVALARKRTLKNPVWKNYYIPFEAMLEPEDVYLSGLLAYTNMISVGTTCFAEAGGPHPDEMGRAAMDTGIRGYVALSTMDQGDWVPPSMKMTTRQALKRNVDLVKRWRGNDRVGAWLSLRQIMVCSPALIRDMGAAAREHDVKIHTHLCEGTYEIDYALEKFGKRPAEFMQEMGVFDRRLHCAHSVMLSPEEMDLYVKHRASACHCATNNYHIGPMRLLEMWRRGVDVGLGTDGAASWGPLDLFQAAHIARVGQSALFGTPWHNRTLTSGEEMLAIATRGGARALGLADQIGTLEAGKKADILLVDCEQLDQAPVYDPMFVAANTTVGRDVKTAIIDGRVVMRDREILTMDVARIKALAAERLPRLMRRLEDITK
ncbi:MAG: amidohydrolase family protein [Betaproteobacteria bacterium]|nr:amidohydrolase family protein [Betaproteobacteria bacterium]